MPQILEHHRAGLSRVVQETARSVEGWAKVFAPIDTGFLRNSITAERSGDPLTWFVNVGAEYGIHQEFGTVYQTGTPFMRPAVAKMSDAFVNNVAAVLRTEKK